MAEQENLFWQSILNSTNPAEFEAYLAQFPNGVFRGLAEILVDRHLVRVDRLLADDDYGAALA